MSHTISTTQSTCTPQTTSTGSWFPDYTIESAPPTARRSIAATEKHLGYLPAAVARMAASPHLLDGFGKLSAIFESSTLDPVAREVLVMTIATRNHCHICLAMHTARLTALGAAPDLIAGLRSGAPLADEHLEALRVFTLGVLATAGDVGEQALRAFLGRGYTSQNALEVVLGIGTYTMSTLANRLTGAPLDDHLAAFG
jgi:AhpD family alkylhydroperoxidase